MQNSAHQRRVNKPEPPLKCSVLLCFFVSLGILAVVFLILMFTLTGIAPAARLKSREELPTIYQGNLVLYPSFLDPDTNTSYLIKLPGDVAESKRQLQQIISSYSEDFQKYTDCYMVMPSRNKPCSFKPAWLGDKCNEKTNFGYDEVDGKYNPCVTFRLEQVNTWAPAAPIADVKKIWDFSQIRCYPLVTTNSSKMDGMEVFPVRGFPNIFFPVSAFDSNLYMLPAVTIRFVGILKGSHVNVECALIASNSISLWNNGIVQIKFQA